MRGNEHDAECGAAWEDCHGGWSEGVDSVGGQGARPCQPYTAHHRTAGRTYGVAGAGTALNVPDTLTGFTSIVPFISVDVASVPV